MHLLFCFTSYLVFVDHFIINNIIYNPQCFMLIHFWLYHTLQTLSSTRPLNFITRAINDIVSKGKLLSERTVSLIENAIGGLRPK